MTDLENKETNLGDSDQEPEEIEVSDQPKKQSKFRRLYLKYKAKGKWFLVGFFIFYLIRDTILYIILPYYLAKGGISLFGGFGE